MNKERLGFVLLYNGVINGASLDEMNSFLKCNTVISIIQQYDLFIFVICVFVCYDIASYSFMQSDVFLDCVFVCSDFR